MRAENRSVDSRSWQNTRLRIQLTAILLNEHCGKAWNTDYTLNTGLQLKAQEAFKMKTLLHALDSKHPSVIWGIALLLVLLLSVLAATIGSVVLVELFFVFPVMLTSWYGSKKSGAILGLLSASILLVIKDTELSYSWLQGSGYFLSCALAFIFLAVFITNFREVYEVEVAAADTDDLTMLNNTRGFYIHFAEELKRVARYSHTFSLAYLDIDNFKFVNDMFGHAEGDRVLVEVASCLERSLRATDTIARVGGDEFICLLPETNQQQAKKAFVKVSALLKEQMTSYEWPVGFSVGIVTFEAMPANIKEAIKIADELMYTVKNSEKNKVSYKVWRGKMNGKPELFK